MNKGPYTMCPSCGQKAPTPNVRLTFTCCGSTRWVKDHVYGLSPEKMPAVPQMWEFSGVNFDD